MNFGKSKTDASLTPPPQAVLPTSAQEILENPGPVPIIQFIQVVIEEAHRHSY
jgi:hypothetical protein